MVVAGAVVVVIAVVAVVDPCGSRGGPCGRGDRSGGGRCRSGDRFGRSGPGVLAYVERDRQSPPL